MLQSPVEKTSSIHYSPMNSRRHHEVLLAVFVCLMGGLLATYISGCKTKTEPDTFKTEADSAGYVEVERDVPLGNQPSEVIGKLVYEQQCVMCHTVDGSSPKAFGPTFKNLYLYEVSLQEGRKVRKVLADEDYLRESIQNPNAKVRAGFGNVTMPTFNYFRNDEIQGIITFIKMQSDKYTPPMDGSR